MSHDLEHRAETNLSQVPTQATVESQTKKDEPKPDEAPRRRGRGLLVKVGAPVAGLAIATGAFLGLKGNGGENTGTPPDNDQQGQEQIDPNGGNNEDDPIANPEQTPDSQPSTPAELVNVNSLPDSIVEDGTFQLLSPEKQARMRELDAMDVPTFRAQPYPEQVSFCMQVLDNMRPRIDNGLDYNGVDLKYTDNPTTNQEIMDNITYVYLTAARLVEETDDGQTVYDRDLALKLESLIQDPSIADTGALDEQYSAITPDSLWGYTATVEAYTVHITAEHPADENGVITLEYYDQNGSAVGMLRPVEYTRMIDGQTAQIYTIIEQHPAE